jgi:hypothetical protein
VDSGARRGDDRRDRVEVRHLNYQYRLKKASWGIFIDIEAEALAATRPPNDAQSAADGLWLKAPADLAPAERGFLLTGLRLVAAEVRRCTLGAPHLVHVKEVRFAPPDYQPDGLAAALAEWAAHWFGFEKPDIPVFFDPQKRRYVFKFPVE